MNKLKYLTLLLLLSVVACVRAQADPAAGDVGEVIVLNKADFLTKVFNYDKERELAGTFGVSSIPTIIFVPMKGEPQVSMGAMPEESFVKMIEEVLLEKKK